jgi:RNA polymerase sigma-70 factor, ECF subfamily
MTAPSCLSPHVASLCDFADPSSASFAGLIKRVQEGDDRGMAELYEYLSAGLRPYLARQLRAQDFHDKIHNIFLDVVVAIRRGQLREPERLMGFARTIARRHVSGYIDAAAASRRNQVEVGSVFWLASPRATPEQEMISSQQKELVRWTLANLAEREGEILSRFYVQEQSQAQICLEMGLTHTQYRLLKWRSKAHFEQLSRKKIASPSLRALGACAGH